MSDLTMTVGDLLNAVPGLQQIGVVKIPSIVASYALAKAKRKANAELETIEALRVALCERHGTMNGDGRYHFDDPSAFEAEWKLLLAQPVTLTGVRAVTIQELAGAETSPDVLFALGPFIADDPEPSPPAAVK